MTTIVDAFSSVLAQVKSIEAERDAARRDNERLTAELAALRDKEPSPNELEFMSMFRLCRKNKMETSIAIKIDDDSYISGVFRYVNEPLTEESGALRHPSPPDEEAIRAIVDEICKLFGVMEDGGYATELGLMLREKLPRTLAPVDARERTFGEETPPVGMVIEYQDYAGNWHVCRANGRDDMPGSCRWRYATLPPALPARVSTDWHEPGEVPSEGGFAWAKCADGIERPVIVSDGYVYGTEEEPMAITDCLGIRYVTLPPAAPVPQQMDWSDVDAISTTMETPYQSGFMEGIARCKRLTKLKPAATPSESAAVAFLREIVAIDSRHERAPGANVGAWVIDRIKLFLSSHPEPAAEPAPCAKCAELQSSLEFGRELIADLRKHRDKLQAFKSWVHSYLDDKGIPKEFPAGSHSKEGCRIGDRMDYVFAEIKRLLLQSARDLEAAQALGVTCKSVPDCYRAIGARHEKEVAELRAEAERHKRCRHEVFECWKIDKAELARLKSAVPQGETFKGWVSMKDGKLLCAADTIVMYTSIRPPEWRDDITPAKATLYIHSDGGQPERGEQINVVCEMARDGHLLRVWDSSHTTEIQRRKKTGDGHDVRHATLTIGPPVQPEPEEPIPQTYSKRYADGTTIETSVLCAEPVATEPEIPTYEQHQQEVTAEQPTPQERAPRVAAMFERWEKEDAEQPEPEDEGKYFIDADGAPHLTEQPVPERKVWLPEPTNGERNIHRWPDGAVVVGYGISPPICWRAYTKDALIAEVGNGYPTKESAAQALYDLKCGPWHPQPVAQCLNSGLTDAGISTCQACPSQPVVSESNQQTVTAKTIGALQRFSQILEESHGIEPDEDVCAGVLRSFRMCFSTALTTSTVVPDSCGGWIRARFSRVKDGTEPQPVVAETEPQLEPIPVGVYYGIDADNFYSSADRTGMGLAFHAKWIDRWKEFPTAPPQTEPLPWTTDSHENPHLPEDAQTVVNQQPINTDGFDRPQPPAPAAVPAGERLDVMSLLDDLARLGDRPGYASKINKAIRAERENYEAIVEQWTELRGEVSGMRAALEELTETLGGTRESHGRLCQAIKDALGLDVWPEIEGNFVDGVIRLLRNKTAALSAQRAREQEAWVVIERGCESKSVRHKWLYATWEEANRSRGIHETECHVIVRFAEEGDGS